jgi:hypothetical protein
LYLGKFKINAANSSGVAGILGIVCSHALYMDALISANWHGGGPGNLEEILVVNRNYKQVNVAYLLVVNCCIRNTEYAANVL